MRRRRASLGFATAALAMGLLGSATALGQAAPPAKAEQPAKSEVKAATTDPSAPLPAGAASTGPSPWQKPGLNGAMRLDFHGSSAVDVGYVKYSFPDNTLVQPNTPDTFYDLRGRFVLGADLDYEFAPKYFFHARGQFVAWVRDTFKQYQGNADDVYVQAGQRDVWDVQLGRFLTWRVFRKGLGFDLYTLEDAGPLNNVHWDDSATFAPHIYEVSEIFFRQTQGRMAVHVYPTPWSGLEVVGEYGRPDATYNTLGGRAAGNVTYGPVSVSVGAEAKRWLLAIPIDACATCGVKNHSGFGGGAVLDFHVVELGANIARARLTSFLGDPMTGGAQDPLQSSTTNSFGGYLEVDPGTLLFQRRLVIGAGWDRSEFLFQDSRFLRHTQQAAYIAYPLGFNDAMVKFVVSQADFLIDTPVPGMPGALTENLNKLFSARLRASFKF
jgi:hypothetical protein